MSDNVKSNVLTLNYIGFETIEYHRDISLNLPKDQGYRVNFERNVQEAVDGSHYKVSVAANIESNDSDVVKVRVKIYGLFTCNHEDDDIKDKLLSKNAVAILFPYLRSQISLVTTQPFDTPIMLPPININALFDESQNQE